MEDFKFENGEWVMNNPHVVSGDFYLHVELPSPGNVRVWQRPANEDVSFVPSEGAAWANTIGCSGVVKCDSPCEVEILVKCSLQPTKFVLSD